jgi:hypothetical protein
MPSVVRDARVVPDLVDDVQAMCGMSKEVEVVPSLVEDIGVAWGVGGGIRAVGGDTDATQGAVIFSMYMQQKKSRWVIGGIVGLDANEES